MVTRRDRSDVDRVRRASIMCDPVELARVLGLLGQGRKVQRTTDGVSVLCPWHSDTNHPACHIRRAPDGTVAVHCFTCDAKGDALSLVAAVRGLDVRSQFREVLEHAAHVAGVYIEPASRGTIPTPQRTSRGKGPAPAVTLEPAPPAAPTIEAPTEPIPSTSLVMDTIAAVLRDHAPVESQPDVAAYLESRGIRRGASGWFALPRESRDLYALRERIVSALAALVALARGVEPTRTLGLDAWCGSGIARNTTDESRGWWLWTDHRLVIPWHAPDGTVTTMQRRPIIETPKGHPKYAAPSGRGFACPWGVCDMIETAGENTIVAIVEGAIDAVSYNTRCAMRGVDACAVAIPGTGGWRDDWARWFRGRIVLVALDADKAGAEKNKGIAATLRRAGARHVEELKPPQGKDWNDVLRSEIRGAA